MKKNTIVILILFCVAVFGAGYYFLFSNTDKAGNTVADNVFGWKFPVAEFPPTGSGGQLAYSDIRDPGGIPQGLPVRLKIPIINVDSTIEDALISPDGRMDVPVGSRNVAWFALGPHPGEVGSAVIGGHFGISNGLPWVFYNLDKLKIGDKIYIENDKGETLAFIVRRTKSFDRNGDSTTVFTSKDGLAHLNLITCEGIWNQVNGTYPERLVVFTDAISAADGASSAAVVPTKGITAHNATSDSSFTRSLSVGSVGADVIALQIFLEQHGLLELPAGVVNGFFGTLTRIAVSNYQASKSLPAIGIFGPQTRANVIAELGNTPVAFPNAGEQKNAVSPVDEKQASELPSPTNSNSVMRSAFATPTDAIITTALLLAILFVVVHLIRRRRNNFQ